MANPYDELMQDVCNSKDLGNGDQQRRMRCTRVSQARRGLADLDRSRRPAVPCRFVVTSKLANGDPQYTIQFRDWKFGGDVVADDFAFKNASGAKPVELTDIKDKVGDLPDNFTAGGSK